MIGKHQKKFSAVLTEDWTSFEFCGRLSTVENYLAFELFAEPGESFIKPSIIVYSVEANNSEKKVKGFLDPDVRSPFVEISHVYGNICPGITLTRGNRNSPKAELLLRKYTNFETSEHTFFDSLASSNRLLSSPPDRIRSNGFTNPPLERITLNVDGEIELVWKLSKWSADPETLFFLNPFEEEEIEFASDLRTNVEVLYGARSYRDPGIAKEKKLDPKEEILKAFKRSR